MNFRYERLLNDYRFYFNEDPLAGDRAKCWSLRAAHWFARHPHTDSNCKTPSDLTNHHQLLSRADETLTITLCDSKGRKLMFKVKRSTVFFTVFKAFAERKKVPRNSLRFYLSGRSIRDSETPEMLNMKDGDVLNVTSTVVRDDTLTVTVRDSSGGQIIFKVTKSQVFSRVFKVYSERSGVPRNNLRFYYLGVHLIGDSETPEMLSMKDGDVLDVTHTVRDY